MLKVFSELNGNTKNSLCIGEPNKMFENGGSWTKAIGRIFQDKGIGFEMTLTYPNGDVDRFYLKDV